MVIVHLLRGGVVEQRVDRQIAPRGILLLIAEHVIAQDATVFVGFSFLSATVIVTGVVPGAKGGDLHRLAPAHHVHDLKAPPDNARAAKQAAHFFGRGAGGHVKILGRAL